MWCVTVAHTGSYSIRASRKHPATAGYRAGLRLGLGDHSSGGGVDHRRNPNRAGRPDSTGRTAGVSGLHAAGALSIDLGGLLNLFDTICLSLHRRCTAQTRSLS